MHHFSNNGFVQIFLISNLLKISGILRLDFLHLITEKPDFVKKYPYEKNPLICNVKLKLLQISKVCVLFEKSAHNIFVQAERSFLEFGTRIPFH